MFTIFINKPEVARTMTMTQYLFSCNPTEKSCISHFYVFMSSLEDVGVGHSDDFYWVPCDALVLRPGTEYIYADCSSSDKGLYVSQPPVLCPNGEFVLSPSRTLRWHYLGWCPSTLHPPRYPTDEESDSDTRLTSTISLDSDPSKSSCLAYFVDPTISSHLNPLWLGCP